MSRYAALEARLRDLNGSVESMAYNFECLTRTNVAMVGLSESMAQVVHATAAQATFAANFAVTQEREHGSGADLHIEPAASPDPVSMPLVARPKFGQAAIVLRQPIELLQPSC